MGIQKKSVVVGVLAYGACAILLMVVVAPALSNLLFSEREVCMLGSIKCHEEDCGRQYLRCGRNGVEDVPTGKVCYRGALIPAERTDLHSCPSGLTAPARNKTFACNCAFCTSGKCECLCATSGVKPVYCRSTNKSYRNLSVANCCGANVNNSCRGTSIGFCSSLTRWGKFLARSSLPSLLVQQIDSLANAFTFASPPQPSNVEGTQCCSSSTCCRSVC